MNNPCFDNEGNFVHIPVEDLNRTTFQLEILPQNAKNIPPSYEFYDSVHPHIPNILVSSDLANLGKLMAISIGNELNRVRYHGFDGTNLYYMVTSNNFHNDHYLWIFTTAFDDLFLKVESGTVHDAASDVRVAARKAIQYYKAFLVVHTPSIIRYLDPDVVRSAFVLAIEYAKIRESMFIKRPMMISGEYSFTDKTSHRLDYTNSSIPVSDRCAMIYERYYEDLGLTVPEEKYIINNTIDKTEKGIRHFTRLLNKYKDAYNEFQSMNVYMPDEQIRDGYPDIYSQAEWYLATYAKIEELQSKADASKRKNNINNHNRRNNMGNKSWNNPPSNSTNPADIAAKRSMQNPAYQNNVMQQPYPQGQYPQQPYPQGQYPQPPQGQYPQQPQGQYPQQQYPQGQYPQPPQGQYPYRPQGQYPQQQYPQGQYPQPPQGQYPQQPQGQYPYRPQGQYPQPPQGQYPQQPYPQGQYPQPPQGQYPQQPYPQGQYPQNDQRVGGNPFNQPGVNDSPNKPRAVTRYDAIRPGPFEDNMVRERTNRDSHVSPPIQRMPIVDRVKNRDENISMSDPDMHKPTHLDNPEDIAAYWEGINDVTMESIVKFTIEHDIKDSGIPQYLINKFHPDVRVRNLNTVQNDFTLKNGNSQTVTKDESLDEHGFPVNSTISDDGFQIELGDTDDNIRDNKRTPIPEESRIEYPIHNKLWEKPMNRDQHKVTTLGGKIVVNPPTIKEEIRADVESINKASSKCVNTKVGLIPMVKTSLRDAVVDAEISTISKSAGLEIEPLYNIELGVLSEPIITPHDVSSEMAKIRTATNFNHLGEILQELGETTVERDGEKSKSILKLAVTVNTRLTIAVNNFIKKNLRCKLSIDDFCEDATELYYFLKREWGVISAEAYKIFEKEVMTGIRTKLCDATIKALKSSISMCKSHFVTFISTTFVVTTTKFNVHDLNMSIKDNEFTVTKDSSPRLFNILEHAATVVEAEEFAAASNYLVTNDGVKYRVFESYFEIPEYVLVLI